MLIEVWAVLYRFDDFNICRKPFNRINRLDSEPFSGTMFEQSEMTLSYVTGITMHTKMKRRVVVLNRYEKFVNRNNRFEFFVDFTNKSLFRRFAWLDFPSGKLPTSLELPIAALGSKYSSLMLNYRGYDFDSFHSRLQIQYLF